MNTIGCSNLRHPIHVQLEGFDVDYPNEHLVDLHDGFNVNHESYSISSSASKRTELSTNAQPLNLPEAYKLKENGSAKSLEIKDDKQKIVNLGVNNYHEYQNNISRSHPQFDLQPMDFSANSIPEIESTDSGHIGDFTAFRNNVSPDTWNELTNNLQFWDPANIP